MPQICSSSWPVGPKWPSSAKRPGLRFKGSRVEELKAIHFQTVLVIQGTWMKFRFYFYERKIGRKHHAMRMLFVCKFTVCLNLWGCTSAGENLENPPKQSGCLPAGDRLLSTAAACFSHIYSLISREHTTRDQSTAKNQIKLYQTLNYGKRMDISECECIDGWNKWIPGLYSFKYRGLRKSFQFPEYFLCCQTVK